MNLLSTNMDEIADVFIRPSRHIYKLSDMGPKNLSIQGHSVTRNDFQTKNRRGLTLHCSHYFKEKEQMCDNFLIYLHCNSGCRIQGLSYLKLAIENDFNYVVFDFSGSGLSEGKYVSLGFHQVQDLETVINYVKHKINEEAKFCLWGRSMGAATALRYLGKHKESIKVAIFDSPFSSLKKLFLEIGKQKTNFPEILLSVVYKYIKPIIFSKSEFDIDEVDLQETARQISNTPGIFIASKQDSLIPYDQIDEVFKSYKGQKEMFYIEQSHNEARNMNVIRSVFKTMKKYFLLSEQISAKKQKTTFCNHLPQKDLSKQKLELTIKSHSQKILKFREPIELNKAQHIQIQFVGMEKKQSSCLITTNKFKRQKKISEANVVLNHSESFLETKRKPLAVVKHFASEQNLVIQQNKGRPRLGGEAKMIQIKMNIKEGEGRSKERKTFQHISSKRPPFVQMKGARQFRSSFQLRPRP